METMVKIKLSSIRERASMSVEDIINWCMANWVSTIVNDFGYGLEFDVEDLPHVWDDIKNL